MWHLIWNYINHSEIRQYGLNMTLNKYGNMPKAVYNVTPKNFNNNEYLGNVGAFSVWEKDRNHGYNFFFFLNWKC